MKFREGRSCWVFPQKDTHAADTQRVASVVRLFSHATQNLGFGIAADIYQSILPVTGRAGGKVL